MDVVYDLAIKFLQAFVPIFVAIDALGVLPLFIALTEDLDAASRNRMLAQSIGTAFVIAVAFIFLGQAVFGLMGITISDFAIAGGAIVFIIATSDIITGRKHAREAAPHGAVPLGTPLIVGPATLTTTLLLVPRYGLGVTLGAVLVNLALAWLLLRGAGAIERLMGKAGSRAMSKVAGLILAAYAVMMIRTGVMEAIAAAGK